MSPAHVLQPTYDRLKCEIMRGVWAQNVRLEPARIAEDYGVSATPVRDSLNLLVGEGLIFFRPGEGYRTLVLTERDLAELLAINLLLLQGAIDAAAPMSADTDRLEAGSTSSYAHDVAALFRKLGHASGNRVHGALIERMSDRLHQMRTREHLVFPDLEEEFSKLRASVSFGAEAAKGALAAFHKRRVLAVRMLAAVLP